MQYNYWESIQGYKHFRSLEIGWVWAKASDDMFEMDFVRLFDALADNSRKSWKTFNLNIYWLKNDNIVSRSRLIKY